MKPVYVAETPAQAHVVAGLLEETGVEAVVEGEMLTGARFALSADASSLPTVFVNDEDVERARAAIAERMPRPSEPPIETEEAVPERASLTWFKAFVLFWLVSVPVFVALAQFLHPVLTIGGSLALGVVVAWPSRRRR